jgi:REP element-mobilizing transposase RayT
MKSRHVEAVMVYDPEKHHRRSIRLNEYDYSRAGAYFITICTQEHLCLFGTIKNEKMVLNAAGEMVECWWNELENKYSAIEMDKYVIMPNHFHGIIKIVGADLCVCPKEGEHIGSPLQQMVQWFKTMTTNAYIRNVKVNHWQPFNVRLWQRNYFEHIIRNQESLNKIRSYIVQNPINWSLEKDRDGLIEFISSLNCPVETNLKSD